jgi:hypothetical protein
MEELHKQKVIEIIDKYMNDKLQEIIKIIEEASEFRKNESIEEIKKTAEKIKQALSIKGIDEWYVLDILDKGGHVLVTEYENTYYEAEVNVTVGGWRAFNWNEAPKIRPGKYKIVLIIQRLKTQ